MDGLFYCFKDITLISCVTKSIRCLHHPAMDAKTWVISHVPIFHITQPLDSIRY